MKYLSRYRTVSRIVAIVTAIELELRHARQCSSFQPLEHFVTTFVQVPLFSY